MKSKKISAIQLTTQVLQRVAPRIGARVVLEPKWGRVGTIIFKNGRRRYFRGTTLDINRVGSSDVAKDKDYAKYFMEEMGYPVIPGKAFFSRKWAEAIKEKNTYEEALAYAQKIGWPVIVKPNSKSQGVSVTKVQSVAEFKSAWNQVEKQDKIILVEEFKAGSDYRIVVLDNKIISAYQRIPLSVTGDGKLTVLQLLEKKQKLFKKNGRDTIIKFNDPRMKAKLARQKLSFDSVLKKGDVVYLLDNANLSGGGDSLDVTSTIHEGFKKLAIRLTKDMGLRLCGVDLMTETSITEAPQEGKHWIIEINAAPGLDHYATIGREQEEIVEDLYLEVLEAMAKGD